MIDSPLRFVWAFTVAAVLFAAACDKPPRQRVAAPAPADPSTKPTGIDLRTRCEVGFKGTYVSTAEYKGTGRPLKVRDRIDFELTKVEGDRYTWKKVMTMSVDSWGDIRMSPEMEMGLTEKNRVDIIVEDARGRIISSEGGDPNGPQRLEAYPDRLLAVGDTWERHSDLNGTRTDSRFTLTAIERINGKEYAVIHEARTGRGISQSSTRWVDLTTGIMVKFDGGGTMINVAGEQMELSARQLMLDATGQPVLP